VVDSAALSAEHAAVRKVTTSRLRAFVEIERASRLVHVSEWTGQQERRPKKVVALGDESSHVLEIDETAVASRSA